MPPRRSHNQLPFTLSGTANLTSVHQTGNGPVEKGRASFLRSFGNLTQENDRLGLFPAESWSLATWRVDQGLRIPEDARVALAVAVDELGRESSIVLGTRNGPIALEAPAHLTRDGETWVPAEVVRLAAQYRIGVVAVNYSGRARQVADKISELLPEVEQLRLTGPNYSAACARVKAEITEAKPGQPSDIQHGSEPHLTAAMKAAVEDNRLKTGPVWGIGETREPIEVLEAATVCAWAVDHMPAPAPAPAGPFEIW